MQPYDYAHRKGVRAVSWEEFADLARHLAESLDRAGVETVVGIARAGLFPATAVACSLRREMFPVCVTRRVNDVVTFSAPVWRVPVPPDVAGRAVAVVDEIADTGETPAAVAEQVRKAGAGQVVTACLASHTWASPAPDFSAIVTDELVIWPWDRQVLVDGRWQLHPEIAGALRAQGRDPDGGPLTGGPLTGGPLIGGR